MTATTKSTSIKLTVLSVLVILVSCGGEENTFRPLPAPPENSFYADREVEVIFENDPDGINIIYMGDGYIKESLGKQFGIYRAEAIEHFDHIFSKSPFAQYKQYFNAYIVYAESEDVGIDGPHNSDKNTALDLGHADFEFGTNNFTVPAYQDREILESYAREAVPDLDEDDLILVSAHLAGGGTGGGGIAVFGSGNTTVMLHEVGHAFGNLGDEYFFEDYETSYDDIHWANLDITNDLDNIKWSQFIGINGYDRVAAFEGGGYTPAGVWRPEHESLMGFGEEFNAPSRLAIVQRIHEIMGLPFDFDQFIAEDVIPPISGRSIRKPNEHPLIGCMIPYQ